MFHSHSQCQVLVLKAPVAVWPVVNPRRLLGRRVHHRLRLLQTEVHSACLLEHLEGLGAKLMVLVWCCLGAAKQSLEPR
eukprot:SAG31_NODE_1180_length_9525_cov_4.989497_12_plen_79_part_00